MNVTKANKYSFIDCFLPFFMVLAPYSVLGISNFFFYILLFYSLALLLYKNQKPCIHKYLFYFVMCYTFISFSSILRRTETIQSIDINNFLMPWLMFIVISTTISKIHLDNLYKVYAVIGTIAMIIMYIQAIGLLVFNVPAVPINLLPVSPDQAHYWNYFRGERPSAIFSEPQAYASFMLPLLAFALNKKKKLFSAFIIFSILLSTSSQGILLVGVILVFVVFQFKNWYYKLFFAVLITLTIIMFFSLPVFNSAKEKIEKIDLEDNIRLTRGFFIYFTFDNMADKIWGIGDGKQKAYVENNLWDLYWVKDHANNPDKADLLGFSTTFSRILISAGIFPFVLFLVLLFRMAKDEDKKMLIFWVIIFVSSFSQTLLFNMWFLFYYLLYLGCCDNYNYSKKNYWIKTYKKKTCTLLV